MLSIAERERLLAQRLRTEREKRRISQIDLAFKADLSQNIVAMIETGKRVPNVSTLFKICDALEISPAVLFCEPDENRGKAKEQIISLLNLYM